MICLADKRRWKKFFPAILMAAAMAVGVTSATVIHKLTMENPVKTPTVEGSIPEEMDPKQAQFQNDGEADVFLRVAYSETWTDKDGMILPNQAAKKDGTLVAVATPQWDWENWTVGEDDGWHYYNFVLPGSKSGKAEGERKTNQVVNGVDFVSFDELADTRYQDAKYEIHFVMEIVQASDDWEVSQDAVKEMFGLTLAEPAGWQTDKYQAVIDWLE